MTMEMARQISDKPVVSRKKRPANNWRSLKFLRYASGGATWLSEKYSRARSIMIPDETLRNPDPSSTQQRLKLAKNNN